MTDEGTDYSPRIRFVDVAKTFNSHGSDIAAVQDINLSVAPGEFVALVGPSGSGKSTLLNMTSGMLQPSRGEVLYDGKPIAGLNRGVGYMTQKDTLFPWRSVAENIGLPLELACRGMSRADRADRVRQMIELIGLKGFENHVPGELSGGMRKRVALARTIIYEPETLLMDEPFGALDAQLKLVMLDELQRLTQQRKMTVLFVTHDLSEAISLADRIVVFSARPGSIRRITPVALPRPRDVFKVRFQPAFNELNEMLWNEMQDDVLKAEAAA